MSRKSVQEIEAPDGSVMVLIPAGEFIMGSDEGDSDERPAHMVYLDGYLIDRTPVTWGQYVRFCEDTGREMPSEPGFPLDETHPVVNVSWYDAAAYCKWAGKRLPTEAEWEKAASGTDGRIWPWGNNGDPKKANTRGRGTTPVGSYPAGASPYGVLDMAGNAWNWCADLYSAAYYTKGHDRNPRGPKGGQDRALRGGSWYDDQVDARCANRLQYDPTGLDDFIGFRGARDL